SSVGRPPCRSGAVSPLHTGATVAARMSCRLRPNDRQPVYLACSNLEATGGALAIRGAAARAVAGCARAVLRKSGAEPTTSPLCCAHDGLDAPALPGLPSPADAPCAALYRDGHGARRPAW